MLNDEQAQPHRVPSSSCMILVQYKLFSVLKCIDPG